MGYEIDLDPTGAEVPLDDKAGSTEETGRGVLTGSTEAGTCMHAPEVRELVLHPRWFGQQVTLGKLR